MHLVDTNDSIEMVLSGAVTTSEVQATGDWSDVTASGFTPGHSDTQSNGATPVTVVASPGASTYRVLTHLSFYNRDTVPVTLTVSFNNNTTLRELAVVFLQPFRALEWTPENGWTVPLVNYATSDYEGPIRIATDAEMEAGTSTAVAVTPGKMHLHPAVAVMWIDSNGAGTTINASYNVAAITDQGTGRLGVNFTTGLASRDYCIKASIERGVTTYAVADVEGENLRYTARAPGFFEIESFDHTATTQTTDDPASYYAVAWGDMVP